MKERSFRLVLNSKFFFVYTSSKSNQISSITLFWRDSEFPYNGFSSNVYKFITKNGGIQWLFWFFYLPSMAFLAVGVLCQSTVFYLVCCWLCHDQWFLYCWEEILLLSSLYLVFYSLLLLLLPFCGSFFSLLAFVFFSFLVIILFRNIDKIVFLKIKFNIFFKKLIFLNCFDLLI